MSLVVQKYRIAGIIGNILEHYDQALFSFVAPFIATLVFNKNDPLTALILTYGLLPLGMLSRPLGSLFFGWIGDKYGRRSALCYSLTGMGFITVCMGFLPLPQTVGLLSPLCFALSRLFQNFFAAGESIGGAIFVLEHTPQSKRGWVSSLYDASSILGILIASAAVALMSRFGAIEEGWRYLFWCGGLVAIFGVILRLKSNDSKSQKVGKHYLGKSLYKHKKALIGIICASGFSYTTYSLAFTLMNGYVPLITNLTKTDLVCMNTYLLLLDMLLLPCCGFIAMLIGKEKLMLYSSTLFFLTITPLFNLLPNASIAVVVVVRCLILSLGVAFSASYHFWAMERVSAGERYTILALGYAIGSQLIGAPITAISLWLYKKTGRSEAFSLYLMVIAASAALAVYYFSKQESRLKAALQ